MRVNKSLKMDFSLAKKAKKVAAHLKRSEHSYLLDAIGKQVSTDLKKYNIDPELFQPGTECVESGVYKVLFFDFCGDMMTSCFSDYWLSQQVWDKKQFENGDLEPSRDIEESSLLASMLTEKEAGKKYIKGFMYIKSGDLFPKFEKELDGNCYELLKSISVEGDCNYELDKSLLVATENLT